MRDPSAAGHEIRLLDRVRVIGEIHDLTGVLLVPPRRTFNKASRSR
jgi:hypothetical protein